uniref:Endonuclease n=1 Tax=Acrobeloides nanus TaxID=290746 RepID=A0A914C308_9BILA
MQENSKLLMVMNAKIEQVKQYRYIGIDLDPKLDYKNHVARITTKCKQATGTLNRTVRKWAPKAIFVKLYKTTIEPIICMPSNPAKLTTNDFATPYSNLLEKMGWKSVSQMAMEKRAVIVNNYMKGNQRLLDNAIVARSIENIRHSTRVGHALRLSMPTSKLKTVQSSSLNTAQQIWNALPIEVVTIGNPGLFKNASVQTFTSGKLVGM